MASFEKIFESKKEFVPVSEVVDKIIPTSKSKNSITKSLEHTSTTYLKKQEDRIVEILKKCPADAILVTSLEEVAWILDFRMQGRYEFDHLFNAHLLLSKNGDIILFTDDVESEEIEKYVGQLNVEVKCFEYESEVFERIMKKKEVMID